MRDQSGRRGPGPTMKTRNRSRRRKRERGRGFRRPIQDRIVPSVRASNAGRRLQKMQIANLGNCEPALLNQKEIELFCEVPVRGLGLSDNR
jgi:hypothetical protein